jgi:hypothetical protein
MDACGHPTRESSGGNATPAICPLKQQQRHSPTNGADFNRQIL